MPQVHVNIREGRGPEKVRELIGALSQAVIDTLGAPPETVQVIVTEVPATHWARGGVTLAEKAASQARPDADR